MNRKDKKNNKKKYISISVYANSEKGGFITERLGREATSRDFVDALVEKLSTVVK